MAVKTLDQYIETSPNVAGGKPRIAGRRITVQQIMIWHERMGLGADEIASEYELTLSQVYAALAYYYDHRREIDEAIKEGEAYADAMRSRAPSQVLEKLHGRKG